MPGTIPLMKGAVEETASMATRRAGLSNGCSGHRRDATSPGSPEGPIRKGLLGGTEDGDGAGKGTGAAAEVVSEAQVGPGQLAGVGLALELLIDLVDHADAAGADGMAEAFEAAVGIDGQLALQAEGAAGPGRCWPFRGG